MYPVQICQLLGERLHELAQQQRWPEALAQCWHSLAFARAATYHQATAVADRSSLNNEASQLTDRDVGFTAWRIADFVLSIERRPIVLLRGLAMMAAALPSLASGQLAIQLDRSIYSGYVINCSVCQWDVNDQANWLTVYVVECPSARTDSQAASLHAHTAPYHLVPDKIGNYHVRVTNSGSPILDEQLNGIRSSGRAVRVYIAEFLDAPHFLDEPSKSRDSRWIAKGLINENLILQAALEHLAAAHKAGSDIIVFPELTITEKIATAIRHKLLRQTPDLSNSGAPRGLALVVCGSFHYPTQESSGYCNVTYAFDGVGNTVHGLTHKKLAYVSLGGASDSPLNEAIDLGDTISLIATPVGLLCSCICLDLAQTLPGYEIPLAHIPFTYMFVPSLSQTTNAQLRNAQNILLHQYGVVICANQSRAVFRGTPTEWTPGGSFVCSSVLVLKPQILNPIMQFEPYMGGLIFDVPIPPSTATTYDATAIVAIV